MDTFIIQLLENGKCVEIVPRFYTESEAEDYRKTAERHGHEIQIGKITLDLDLIGKDPIDSIAFSLQKAFQG